MKRTRSNSLITSIIFSKNRPLQLDLTIKSIKQNFPDCSKIIVLHNNDTEFTEAHSILCSEHKDIESWQQSGSIFSDVFAASITTENDLICFFTDDNICYKLFECENYDFLQDEYASCLSLRMGMNITERCHNGVTGQDKCQKMFYTDNDMIAWPKTWHGYGSYWSYDLSVDGHIFRKADVVSMMDELCFLQSRYNWNNTPNVLESEIQRFWPIRGNYIIAPKHSVVVNSPNNRVQESHQDNRAGDVFNYDSGYLRKQYMSGNRINIDYLDFGEIKCPHTEIDLIKGIK